VPERWKFTRVALDERLFADHNRIHQPGNLLWPKRVDSINDAAVNARPPKLGAAATESRQKFQVSGLG
jgi:hypothetical protein